MAHFRYVPRAVLWRYPSATGVRLPRSRSRKPPVRPGRDEYSTRVCVPAQGGGEPGSDLPADEVFGLASADPNEDRSHVRRQLERLIKAYNVTNAHPG